MITEYIQHEVYVDLKIMDFDDLSHKEIIDLIGSEPTIVYIKGERINPKFSRLAKKNGLVFSSPFCKHGAFDIQLNSILDLIEQKYDVFKLLSSKYYCEISCTTYIDVDADESTPWIHLNSRYNKLIKELNIEFDVDIMLVSKRQ